MRAEAEREGARREAPRAGSYLLAWLLASAPLIVRGELAESLGDASRLALAWIPWIVVAGLPTASEARRGWPLALGLALPQLALAAWVDLRLGLGPARLEATFLGGLICALFLGEARYRAAEGRISLYGPIWFLLVALLPALVAALSWGVVGRSPEDGALARLASFSPIAATWRDVQPLEGDLAREAWNSALFCPSSLACILLWLGIFSLSRRSGARS